MTDTKNCGHATVTKNYARATFSLMPSQPVGNSHSTPLMIHFRTLSFYILLTLATFMPHPLWGNAKKRVHNGPCFVLHPLPHSSYLHSYQVIPPHRIPLHSLIPVPVIPMSSLLSSYTHVLAVVPSHLGDPCTLSVVSFIHIFYCSSLNISPVIDTFMQNLLLIKHYLSLFLSCIFFPSSKPSSHTNTSTFVILSFLQHCLFCPALSSQCSILHSLHSVSSLHPAYFHVSLAIVSKGSPFLLLYTSIAFIHPLCS